MAFMGHKPVPPEGEIVFDMYTSCAWLSAASGLLSLLVFLPGVFRETFIADRELEALKTMADQNQETAGAEQRIMRSVNAMSKVQTLFMSPGEYPAWCSSLAPPSPAPRRPRTRTRR